MKMTKAEWFEKNGFTADGYTYSILGNTYPKKAYLKMTCVFSKELKWHRADPFSEEHIPEGCQQFKFAFDDFYQFNEFSGKAEARPEAMQMIGEIEVSLREPSASEYVGEVGERLVDIPVEMTGMNSFEGMYGLTYCYTFKKEENILVWFTQKLLTYCIGDRLILRGTVKNHTTYQGVRQTQLTRCIVSSETAF